MLLMHLFIKKRNVDMDKHTAFLDKADGQSGQTCQGMLADHQKLGVSQDAGLPSHPSADSTLSV